MMEQPCVCSCGDVFELDDGNACSECDVVHCEKCQPVHDTVGECCE